MPTVFGYHDVKDTNHWLASPKREEFFGPRGVTNISYLRGSGEADARRGPNGCSQHGRAHGGDGDPRGGGSDGV